MAEGKPRSTDPPKCKTCGVPHKGTCADHDARGAISMQITAPLPKTKMIEGVARRPTVLQIVNHAVESLPALSAKDVTPATKLRKARKALTEAEKRSRGRPKTIKDMKAYKAKKAKDRRAAEKAAKEAKPDAV